LMAKPRAFQLWAAADNRANHLWPRESSCMSMLARVPRHANLQTGMAIFCIHTLQWVFRMRFWAIAPQCRPLRANLIVVASNFTVDRAGTWAHQGTRANRCSFKPNSVPKRGNTLQPERTVASCRKLTFLQDLRWSRKADWDQLGGRTSGDGSLAR
jgi:hypothetical protein